MRVEIVARNYKVSDHLREIIESKMEKFSRYFEEDTVVKVTLKEVKKDTYAMEITLNFGTAIVRSEVVSNNMYDNIDIALPKIEGQIRKHRTQLEKIRKSAIDAERIYEPVRDLSNELVKTKSFELRKISVEEAIVEMELVDHDFFAFINEKNGLVNIVYRRQDGKVGLLDLIY